MSKTGLILFVLTVCLFAFSDAALNANEDPWTAVKDAVDQFDGLSKLAIIVGADDIGVSLNYSKGGFKTNEDILVASSTKIMSSTAIWTYIQSGLLSLDDYVSKHVSWWTTESTDLRSKVKLRHLLSFTSGFNNDTCNGKGWNDQTCAEWIYNSSFSGKAPGSEFYYCSDHLQIAGYMTKLAAGVPIWNTLWKDRVVTPLGIPANKATIVPLTGPNLAGGLFISTDNYVTIFRDLYTSNNPKILNLTTRALREVDLTPNSEFVYSPVSRAGYDWHYSGSFWLECPFDTWNSTCDNLKVYSSPGAFGFYPLIDRKNDFWMVLGTYNATNSINQLGVTIVQEILPSIRQALKKIRNQSTPSAASSINVQIISIVFTIIAMTLLI